MQRFWATDGNRKCAVFVFNLSSHYHIYIFKHLFTSRDDYFENLRETTVLACEMFTSSCRPWLKNVACLSSLFFLCGDGHLQNLTLRPGGYSIEKSQQITVFSGVKKVPGEKKLSSLSKSRRDWIFCYDQDRVQRGHGVIDYLLSNWFTSWKTTDERLNVDKCQSPESSCTRFFAKLYFFQRNYDTRAWVVEFIDTIYSKVRIPFGGKVLSWPISHLFCHVNSKNNYLIIL